MNDPTITCPNCKTEIKLTESLAAPLLESTRQQYERRLADKETEAAEKLKVERTRISEEEAKKARLLLSADLEQKTKELTALQEVLKQRDEKLAEAQKAQAEIIRKQRELDDAKREMDLTIEKKVQESLDMIRDKAKQEAEEGLQLKVAEKEEIIAGMQRQIEELKRKSERRSEQLQGEVLELELEDVLRRQFPFDDIVPVPKGIHGGDIVQIVRDAGGGECGIILWESKRTKNWNDGWLAKLRDDQRAAKAHIAMLVSMELPKGVTTFESVEGVWVTNPSCALALAAALRMGLIQVAAARRAADGKQTKMELLYNYLSGQEFRHRIEGIVEAFITLKQDLDAERRTMQRAWAKREKQLERATLQAAGLHGDLSGLMGKALPSIDKLQLPVYDSNGESAVPAEIEES
jgi:hypothetical protein